jgi:hypothetical protein
MTGDEALEGFEDIVAAVTPRVVEEALEQGVEQARKELAARFARAIVERAVPSIEHAPRPGSAGVDTRTETAGDPAPETSDASRRDASSRGPVTPKPHTRVQSTTEPAGTGLYAFAVIPPRPVDLTGLAGIDGRSPLRIIQHADLGLVVSEMPLDLMDDVSEDDLSETGPLATLARRHDDVVRSVFEHGPVLPLRFGTVVADDDGARRLLDEQGSRARRRLEHLDTHREWGVRLNREVAEQPTGEDEASRRQMTGTSYLASRRAALQKAQDEEQQKAALTEQVEQALRDYAVDAVRRGGGPGSGVLTDVAYLVPVDAEDRFLDAAGRLGSEVSREHLTLEVTGPWPPYSFASLQQDGPGRRSGEGVVGSA